MPKLVMTPRCAPFALLAASVSVNAGLLPPNWEVARNLVIQSTNGHRRCQPATRSNPESPLAPPTYPCPIMRPGVVIVPRRLSVGSIGDSNGFQVSFHTTSRRYEMDLHRVNLWAEGAKLVVNRGGASSSPPLPSLPTFRGHLANASHSSGGVSATLLHGDRLRIHVFSNGLDVVVESAKSFDDVAKAPSLLQDDFVVHRMESRALKGMLDEELHHSKTPLPGLHIPRPIQRERQLSTLYTLPSGPPYGRLSSCPSADVLYTTTGIGHTEHGRPT